MLFTNAELAAYLGVDVASLNADRVNLLRDLITGEIRQVVGAARYDGLTDLTVFKFIALELTKRAYQNPEGVRSLQESIDDYSRMTTYATETAQAPAMTADERMRIRRAAGLRGSFSITPAPVGEC